MKENDQTLMTTSYKNKNDKISIMQKNKKTKNNLTFSIIKDDRLLQSYFPNPDDLVGTNGIDIYSQMLLDPKVSSLINLLKSRILSYKLILKQSNSNEEVYKRCLNARFDTDYTEEMSQMLSCLIYGYSVNECIWKEENGYYSIDYIKTHHPKKFMFNTFGNLVYTYMGQDRVLDDNYKWLVMQNSDVIDNPYGESVLRSCYWPWKFKQAGLNFWLKATEKFSVPSILALFETEGSDEDVQIRAKHLAEMLNGISSGSSVALANVKKTEAIKTEGSLSDFRSLCDFCDTQISYGITGQSLATGDAQFNARASSQVHQQMFDQQAISISQKLQQQMQKLLNWFVELNYGIGVIAPTVSFRYNTESQDIHTLIELMKNGLDISKEAIYNHYNIPKPINEADSTNLK
jgi:phage gp29-like protein